MSSVDLPIAEVAVEELIERSQERGFVLLSEINEIEQPDPALQDFVEDSLARVRQAGLEVIDDVADDAPEGVEYDTGHLTTDLVRQYLNDAGKHALLTKEDEADLAKRYQSHLAAESMLSADEDMDAARKRLLRRISADGKRAKERMVQANLRLVVPQARKFSGRDLDFIELIQEGNLGLLRAVEKFDHTKGYKFSTYAVWWIRQALQRGVASKARTIRVPAHVWELYGKLRSAETRIRRVLDQMSDSLRIPLLLRDMDGFSYDEIAAQLGIGLSAVKMRIKRGREQFRRLYSELGQAVVGLGGTAQ